MGDIKIGFVCNWCNASNGMQDLRKNLEGEQHLYNYVLYLMTLWITKCCDCDSSHIRCLEKKETDLEWQRIAI